MRVGLVQLTSSDDPGHNLVQTAALIDRAADDGADFILTPEVTNIVSLDRGLQARVQRRQDDDPTLAALRAQAERRGVWLLVGSLALAADSGSGRWHNRSFLIGPDGQIAAHYDKIHMFDVDIDATESFRESAAYAPGDRAVVAQAGAATLGLSVCYDVRFPALYRDLAKAGAQILTVPAAFSPVSGQAHWQVLLRARAIETGCYVLAPAQCGTHPAQAGAQRRTWGHSLIVSPWGEVLADGGTAPGVIMADLDLKQVSDARAHIPSLNHERAYLAPAR